MSLDTVMPIASLVFALAFIAYLTWDTFTSVKAVREHEITREWPEFREIVDTFWSMWLAILITGAFILTGILNPHAWLTWF